MVKKGPVTKLKEDFALLQIEAKTYYENYLRLLAEFDNFRKRKEREFEESKNYAREEVFTELIPVLENFDRALMVTNLNHNFDNLYKGVNIIYNQLKEVLQKQGLVEYSCLGEEFDPKKCEAVNFVETDEKPPNTVIEEMGKGYLYQGKVIRPALVTVVRPKNKELSGNG